MPTVRTKINKYTVAHQSSATQIAFRGFVNSASPQGLVEFFKREAQDDELRLKKLTKFYIENLYTLDGDIFAVKSEQFIEELVRLALETKSTQRLPFVIMAFAPTAPSWSGDMLDWLQSQDYDTIQFVALNILTMQIEHSHLGNSEMAALLERYAAFEAMQTIANRIFEERQLPVFERLLEFSDDEALKQLNVIALRGLPKHETVADWLTRTQADFGDYPFPIISEVVARYTALNEQSKAV